LQSNRRAIGTVDAVVTAGFKSQTHLIRGLIFSRPAHEKASRPKSGTTGH
jgi:hypothetical protein